MQYICLRGCVKSRSSAKFVVLIKLKSIEQENNKKAAQVVAQYAIMPTTLRSFDEKALHRQYIVGVLVYIRKTTKRIH